MIEAESQQWCALADSFQLWREINWRLSTPGNNRLPKVRERAAVRAIYDGYGFNEIVREFNVPKVSLRRIADHLQLFLSQHPEFPAPKCKCGRPSFHRGHCESRDGWYIHRARKNGLETQRRDTQTRRIVLFFEMQESVKHLTPPRPGLCACGCGKQTTRLKYDDRTTGMKAGEYRKWVHGHWHKAVRRRNPKWGQQCRKHREFAAFQDEIRDYAERHPGISREALREQFKDRGYNSNSLTQLILGAFRSVGMDDPFHVPEPEAARADIFFQTINATKHMTTLDTTIETEVHQFAALVQRGIDAWTEAGKLLLDMLKRDPNARETIMESCPDITEEILSRFEAIGRQQLHPKTLLNNSPGMRRLRLLPFSEQEKFLAEPVPVLVLGDGGVDTLNVAVKNLTPQQAQQVFARDGVRRPDAQRAWLESRRTKRRRPTSPYQIKGNRVVFKQDCEMTAKDLAQLLTQIS